MNKKGTLGDFLVVHIEEPPVLQPEDGIWSPVLGEYWVSVLTDGEGGDALHLLTKYEGPPGPTRCWQHLGQGAQLVYAVQICF